MEGWHVAVGYYGQQSSVCSLTLQVRRQDTRLTPRGRCWASISLAARLCLAWKRGQAVVSQTGVIAGIWPLISSVI